MELPALDLAGRVVDAAAPVARRPDLRREPPAGLQRVAVGRDVERLREGRVRDGAVVALEEVLHADLPVGRVLVGDGPCVEAQRVDVEAAVGEQRRELPERVRERRGRRIGVDEDERPPGVDRDGDEAERLAVEARLAVGARRVAEGAVQAVRPRVVRALDRLAARVPVAERVAPVPADVHEPAEDVVAGAREHDGQRAGERGGQLAGLRDLVGARGVLPADGEEPLLLHARDGGVGVPRVRQRAEHRAGGHAANLLPRGAGVPMPDRAWQVTLTRPARWR